jgi:hypothetical protein
LWLIHTLSARLSEILMHQATLLEHIVTDQRHYPDYFMVAFCGSFPVALRNKQYIVSGHQFDLTIYNLIPSSIEVTNGKSMQHSANEC